MRRSPGTLHRYVITRQRNGIARKYPLINPLIHILLLTQGVKPALTACAANGGNHLNADN